MTTSFRASSQLMDSEAPPLSLRKLAQYYRWPDDVLPTALSLDLLAKRSLNPSTINIRFLSYNTYLMRVDIPISAFLDAIIGIQGLLNLLNISPVDILHKMKVTALDAIKAMDISTGTIILVLGFSLNPLTLLSALTLDEVLDKFEINPLKLVERLITPSGVLDLLGIKINLTAEPKPALEARSTEIGHELAGRYQLMALSEVWQQDSLDRIKAGWTSPPIVVEGPQLSFQDPKTQTAMGSGLAVLSTLPVVESLSHVYQLKGVNRSVAGLANLDHLVDIDTWAKKSVLLTRIDTGRGIIDLYSTHLYSGGDAIKWLGWAGLPEPSDEEKRKVRIGQVLEFIEFYNETHDPCNVAILTGDFNINGINQDYFDELNEKLEAVGLHDAWTKAVYANPLDGGQTNRSGNMSFGPVCKQRVPDSVKPLSNNPSDYYCDDLQASDTGASGERIDYLYIERPRKEHSYNLEVTRLRRRPFLRKTETDGELYLSDHMGLEIMLLVGPKDDSI